MSYPPENDERLKASFSLWEKFLKTTSLARKIGIIYHGDTDGVVGAAYVRAFFEKAYKSVEICTFWIGTEEYDFKTLKRWIFEQQLDACVILDISIENSKSTLDELAESVKGKIFIFDHHVMYEEYASDRVFIANPTPQKIQAPNSPLPTFTFAYNLARLHDFPFPRWLILLCIFTEGIDSFLEPEVLKLSREILQLKNDKKPRDSYRGSLLGKIASLLRAGFSLPMKQTEALEIMCEIANGNLSSPEQVFENLNLYFGRESERIRRAITNLVEIWKKQFSMAPPTESLVVISIEDVHAVSSTVASVLRGFLPKNVVMTCIRVNDNVVVELRTDNNSPINLVSCLQEVALHVPLINFGGHAPAAGATLNSEYFPEFERRLRDSLPQEDH